MKRKFRKITAFILTIVMIFINTNFAKADSNNAEYEDYHNYGSNIYRSDPYGNSGFIEGKNSSWVFYANLYTRKTNEPETVTAISFNNSDDNHPSYYFRIKEENMDEWTDIGGPDRDTTSFPLVDTFSLKAGKDSIGKITKKVDEPYTLTKKKFVVICKVMARTYNKPKISIAANKEGNGYYKDENIKSYKAEILKHFVRAKDENGNNVILSLNVITKSASTAVDEIKIGEKTVSSEGGLPNKYTINFEELIDWSRIDAESFEIKLKNKKGKITDKVYDENTKTLKFTVLAEDEITKENYTVKLVAPELESLEITPPAKTEYFEGEKFEKEGLQVEAVIKGQQDKLNITEDAKLKLEEDELKEGSILHKIGKDQIVRVSYKGKTAEFKINVKPVEVKKIYLVPESKKYFVGESFAISDLKVMAQMSNGEEKEINEGISANAPAIFTEIGEKEILIKYKNFSEKFIANVVENNKEELKKIIENAKKSEESVKTSSDGKDILPSENWTCESKIDELNSAIENAKKVLKNKNAAQDEIKNMILELKTAISTFNSSIKPGKKPEEDPQERPEIKRKEFESYDYIFASPARNLDLPLTEIQEEISDSKIIINDINGHWAQDSIEKVAKLGYMEISENNFYPQKESCRIEIIKALAKIQNIDPKNYSSEKIEAGISKADQGYINWAIRNGIIKGYEDGSFKLKQEITREEMAAILNRYANKFNIKHQNRSNISFLDEEKISSWAKAEVKEAAANGLLAGRKDGKFDPKSNITRAEVSQIIMNIKK